MQLQNPIYYKRHLPHYQPAGHTFFVTFRLANSLPIYVIEQLKREYNSQIGMIAEIKSLKEKNEQYLEAKWNHFKKFDLLLAESLKNNRLQDERIAKIVHDAIMYRDKKEYDLICFTIMPNHVHMVFHIDEPNKSTNSSNISATEELASKPSEIRDDSSTSHLRRGRISDSTYNVTKILQNLKKFTARECNKLLNISGNFWQHESYDHVVRSEDALNKIIKYVLNNPVEAGLADKPEKWLWNYCKYLL